jgi:hypothetical protein
VNNYWSGLIVLVTSFSADWWEGIGYESGASCSDDINLPRATRRLRKFRSSWEWEAT